MKEAPIEKSKIEAQLKKILASEGFQVSTTLTCILGFLIDTTLDGKDHILKEYTIGVYALGKKSDFSPQKDPIIRIHVHRLRKVLANYYLKEGKDDELIITIPKGSYVPAFSLKSSEPDPDVEDRAFAGLRKRISVAVLPFSCAEYDSDCKYFADGLADQLSMQLTRYSELTVISYFSCRQFAGKIQDIRQAGLLLDALFILTGSVQTDASTLRIRLQLTRSDTGEQIWAQTFECKKVTKSLFDMQDEISWQVVSLTAGHYGVIARNISRLPPQKEPGDLGIYNAMFWYYHFVRDLSEDMFQKAEIAMKTAVANDPDYALAWAILGEILVGGFFMGYKSPLEENQLDAAQRYSKNAIRLDPDCQHGYQTLALVGIFCSMHQESLKVVTTWEKIQHPEPGIMGAMGFILICCEDYERGYRMLMESVQLNPYYQWWYNAGLAFYHLKKNEYDQVIYWADKMGIQQVPWEWMLKMAGHHGLGNHTEANAAGKFLRGHFPNLKENADVYLSAFLKDEVLIETLNKEIRQAFLD